MLAKGQSMDVEDRRSNKGKQKTKPQVDSDEELIWYKDYESSDDEEAKNPTNFGVDWRSTSLCRQYCLAGIHPPWA